MTQAKTSRARRPRAAVPDPELAALRRRLAESQRVAKVGSFERDMAGGGLYWSDELYRLLGFEPGQVLADRKTFTSRLHPDDRAAVIAALGRVSGHGGAFNIETRYLTQNGQVRHARLRAEAEVDGQGRPVRLYGTFQDITEAKQARLELAGSEARYKGLVEGASAVIHTLDAEGRFTYVSPNVSVETGHSPASLLGRAMVELVHEADRARLEGYLERVMRSGKDPAGVEFRWRCSGAGYRWFKTTATVLAGGRDDQSRILGVARDCTDRKLAEEGRRDMELVLQHDLRSPLQGVIQLPQALIDEGGLDERQKRLLSVVSNCGRRMLRAINSFMSMSKLEAGLYRPVSEPVDLATVCREIAAEQSERARVLGIGFAIDGEAGPLSPDETLVACGDGLLVHVMLENLVTNAMDASPRGGTVRMVLRRLEQAVEVTVHNRGAVPEAVRDRFFEKYATCGKPAGTGLGTYSAKLIADNLGGTIALRTSEAFGTTLTVTLPLAPCPSQTA